MSLRKLPEVKAFQRPANFQWDAPSDAMARWAASPLAAASDDPNTITIFDVIGEDFWSGGGFTAKRAAAALRSIGQKDVRVQINSPGGDLFEGLAIYNLLRQHQAKVTIDVMGYAASAASLIAMAGDEIRMGAGTFLMIHDAWTIVIGNQHDLRSASEMLAGIDSGMADVYAARSGLGHDEVAALMDAETWLGASDAVAKGFADSVDDGLAAKAAALATTSDRPLMARRRIEAALAQTGMTRAARTSLIAEITAGARDAAGNPAARDAGIDVAAALRLLNTISS